MSGIFNRRAILSFVSLFIIGGGLLIFSKANASPGKVWIFFKDRPYLKNRAASLKPSFSAEALKRRQTRGVGSSFEENDFAVDRSYVEAVRKAGGIVVRESRWLNAVSAFCDSSCQHKLKSSGIVSEIRSVAVYKREREITTPEKSYESRTAAPSALNYGSSLTQLKQINVIPAHNRGFAGQGELVAVFDTGFRKDHEAFSNVTLVNEKDFVFDDSNVQNGGSFDSHGTGTWACAGAASPGKMYGAGYKARYLLAVTEDIRSETRVEEDNWVAALEWADQLGATVVSSSLGYSDWYTNSDFNGSIPVTSRAASTAASKGILVVNSAGNSGPNSPSLSAPADARNILTVGAVDAGGQIAGFSSRGPTADGRIKPEVVAQGVSTFLASEFSTNSYGRSSGTSFSCPLIAGAAAALFSAHPEWTPIQIREAFMKTAKQAATPDNTFGYGLANLGLALDYLPVNSVVIDQHKPLLNTTNKTTPYVVNARIRAYRGLNTTQLFLFWKKLGAPVFQKVAMTPLPGSTTKFKGLIPAQPAGTTVVYYIFAKDTAGKVMKFPFNSPVGALRFAVN